MLLRCDSWWDKSQWAISIIVSPIEKYRYRPRCNRITIRSATTARTNTELAVSFIASYSRVHLERVWQTHIQRERVEKRQRLRMAIITCDVDDKTLLNNKSGRPEFITVANNRCIFAYSWSSCWPQSCFIRGYQRYLP